MSSPKPRSSNSSSSRLDQHMSQTTGSAQSSTSLDETSVHQRNQKIDQMRARLDKQLENLVKGASFDTLRQQVAELRTSPSLPKVQEQEQEPDFENSLMFRSSLQSPMATFSGPRRSINKGNYTDPMLDTPTSASSKRSAGGSSKSSSSSRSPPVAAAVEHQDRDEEGDIHWTGGDSSSNVDPSLASLLSSEYSKESKQSLAAPSLAGGTRITDPYGDTGTYQGSLNANGKPHGVGTMHYDDGRLYEGDWTSGQWNGQGKVVFANGDVYEGMYLKDQRHGFGTYTWKDGRVYEGEFVQDQRQGLGEYEWPDGANYKGFFHDGHRDGEGTYIFGDGSCYTGEWKEGKYHGLGECVWADGRVYKGEWDTGQAHGYGIETRADGTVRHDGQWIRDAPVRRKKSNKKR